MDIRTRILILALILLPWEFTSAHAQRNRNRGSNNRSNGNRNNSDNGNSSNRNSSGNNSPRLNDLFDGNIFLEKFGYLDDSPNHSHSPDTVLQAVTEFQRFNGLPVTGQLDRQTVTKMRQPRCGMPDVIKPGQRPLSLRGRGQNAPLAYNAPGYKWERNDITFKINGYTRQLGGTTQTRALVDAFRKWSDVTPLTFRQGRGTVDMDISFSRREHGDGRGNSFDGRGGVLAHAFFPGGPGIAGDTHFDDDEQWTMGTDQGTNLEIVAAHEFGHALGLGHSSNTEALMAPFYQGYNPNFRLHQDDIRGIQSLYGGPRRATARPRLTTRRPRPTSRPRVTTRRPRPTRRPRVTTRRPRPTRQPRVTTRRPRPTRRPQVTTRRPRPTRRPRTTRRPNVRPTRRPTTNNCRLRFDAIEQAHDNQLYAFRGSYIYSITSRGPVNRRRIRQVYRGAPNRPGAVVYDRHRRKLFFFKGRRLWRFTGYTKDAGYPKQLPTDFRGVRAALQSGDGGIYLFQNRNYTRWAESLTRNSAGYPRSIRSFWRGMPHSIESAFRGYDGYIYAFKYQRYWRFDTQGRIVPGYPRDMRPVWLNCRRPSRMTSSHPALSFLSQAAVTTQ